MMSDSEDEEDLELSFLLSSALSPCAQTYPQSQGGTPLPHYGHTAVQYPVGLSGAAPFAAAHLPPPPHGHHPVVGELPSPENIAAMSYDELLRFAGEIGTSPLDELD